jgi:hypothetical protein
VLLGARLSAVQAPSPPVPTHILAVDLSGSTASRLREPGTSFFQNPEQASLDYRQRYPLSASSLYWFAGLHGEAYWFESRGPFPLQHLQGYAAQFGLEYLRNGETAAKITLRPGFYFENDLTGSAWDIPIDFVTGLPVTQDISGIIGISAARFYHRPIPVLGISWLIRPAYRLNLAFPEPSFVIQVKPGVEARLGGTLIGSGYRLDPGSNYSKVEYTEYRVGPGVTAEVRPGVKLTGEAGYVTARRFDFFEESQRFKTGGAPYVHLGIEFSR